MGGAGSGRLSMMQSTIVIIPHYARSCYKIAHHARAALYSSSVMTLSPGSSTMLAFKNAAR